MNLKNKRLSIFIWYHSVAMDLIFPYISKKYKCLVYDVIIADFAQVGDFQGNIGQNLNFSPKNF